MPRRFQQVDVFTSVAYMGNPVAVVLDGEGLDDDQLPRFSSWTNLSETTFVLPPTTDAADYRVRIFSLERELPFAGHPTLGTCHAWLEAGGVPRDAEQIVQECGFDAAFSFYGGWNRPGRVDAYDVRRIKVDLSTSMPMFRTRVTTRGVVPV
jgi:PhzF family phenazine biosynthesis protein